MTCVFVSSIFFVFARAATFTELPQKCIYHDATGKCHYEIKYRFGVMGFFFTFGLLFAIWGWYAFRQFMEIWNAVGEHRGFRAVEYWMIDPQYALHGKDDALWPLVWGGLIGGWAMVWMFSYIWPLLWLGAIVIAVIEGISRRRKADV